MMNWTVPLLGIGWAFSIWFSVVVALLMLIFLLRDIAVDRKKKKRAWSKEDTKFVWILPTMTFIVSMLYSIPAHLGDRRDPILPFLEKMLGLAGTRMVVSAFVIGCGVVAYWWKRFNQYSYGLGELLFGVAAVSYITFTITPGKSVLSQWVGLGGAAYVIARGVSNVTEGRAKAVLDAASRQNEFSRARKQFNS